MTVQRASAFIQTDSTLLLLPRGEEARCGHVIGVVGANGNGLEEFVEIENGDANRIQWQQQLAPAHAEHVLDDGNAVLTLCGKVKSVGERSARLELRRRVKGTESGKRLEKGKCPVLAL